MARTVTGVDVGLRTNKLLRGSWKGNTFRVTDFALVAHRARDLGQAWAAGAVSFKPRDARVGLTGRDVNIRYTRVPRVPDWQLRKLMRFEVEEIGGQSGSAVASDFNLLPALPEIEGEDVVLLAMARESLLEEHLAGLARHGGTLDAFAPCALALYDAWIRYGAVEEETVLLASIGHENLDVVLSRGPDLLFARNLSGGSRLFDEAISERLSISIEKAEELKILLATLAPGARYRDANQEKASRACQAAAGQILSLLQSTVAFCKSQVKVSGLRVDRVLLCGGGAALAGLCEYLSAGMQVPVGLFEPFGVVDASALPPEKADLLERHHLESVVALGLATMASDPEAYSVEIVPVRVRRRREFLGGTLFLAAAAGLAALFLGFEGWRTARRAGELRREALQLEAQLRRATTTDRRARELAAENERLAAAALDLQGLVGSGEQVARVVEHLARALPGDFWIESLASSFRADEPLGLAKGDERPVVHLAGRTREGTESVAALLEAFVASLHQAFPQARLVHTSSPSGDRFSVDLTLYGPPREAPADARASPDGRAPPGEGAGAAGEEG